MEKKARVFCVCCIAVTHRVWNNVWACKQSSEKQDLHTIQKRSSGLIYGYWSGLTREGEVMKGRHVRYWTLSGWEPPFCDMAIIIILYFTDLTAFRQCSSAVVCSDVRYQAIVKLCIHWTGFLKKKKKRFVNLLKEERLLLLHFLLLTEKSVFSEEFPEHWRLDSQGEWVKRSLLNDNCSPKPEAQIFCRFLRRLWPIVKVLGKEIE